MVLWSELHNHFDDDNDGRRRILIQNIQTVIERTLLTSFIEQEKVLSVTKIDIHVGLVDQTDFTNQLKVLESYFLFIWVNKLTYLLKLM